jgi:hypothetical protein
MSRLGFSRSRLLREQFELAVGAVRVVGDRVVSGRGPLGVPARVGRSYRSASSDVDIDRRERPQRPLPAGEISASLRPISWLATLACGWAFTGLVSLLQFTASWDDPGGSGPHAVVWVPLLIGTCLAGLVVAYNAGVKRTWWGPVNMGACRTFNILLGMSLAMPQAESWIGGWGAHHLTVALAIGVYIVGVTWFARGEAETSSRAVLATGTTLMAAGWVLLALLPYQVPEGAHQTLAPLHWHLLLAMLAVPVFRRAIVAWSDPSPGHVQAGVKQFIVSLIVLDATVVLLLVSPSLSIVVLALLIPMLLLGRWVYST